MQTWLASKLAAPLAIVAAFALALASTTLGVKLWIAKHDLSSMTTRAESAERDNGTLRVNVTTLTGEVADTNRKLDQMKADGDAREKARVTADAAINAGLAKTTAALIAAKPGPDKCASASALIKDFAK